MSRLVAKVVGPHRFAAYRWLVPVGVPHPSGWHYGLRRGQGPSSPVYRGSMRVDPETLDADLRELVTGLHRVGVATLPSCQGHFGWCAERIKQAARDVAGQESLIHRGLVMRDIEDGSRVMVRDPSWRAPSVRQLAEGVENIEGIGYLGIVSPPPWMVSSVVPFTRLNRHRGRLDVWVKAPNARAQRRAWDRLTSTLLNGPALS
jgi:hypothetical protein